MKIWVILLVALTSFACSEQQTKPAQVQKVKIESVRSAQDDYEISNFSGKILSSEEVNLSFRVAGVIEKIDVKVGDFVKKGQVLARMDKRDYQIQLNATQAEYDAIKGEVDRVVALYEKQSATANDYDKAMGGLKQISAKLAAHTNALSDTQIKAPFDGYIQKINFSADEAVSAGMPIVSLISSSEVEVKINVPSLDYLKRDRLASAVARVNVMPDEVFNLEFKGVAHKANLNQLYEMTFLIDTKANVMPSLGQTAMVELNYENESSDDFVISFSSVFEQDDKCFVWVVSDGKVSQRELKLGEIRTNGEVLVLSGLKQGESVVSAGVNSLSKGQSVEVF